MPHELLGPPVRHVPPDVLPPSEDPLDEGPPDEDPLVELVPELAHVLFAWQLAPIAVQFWQTVPPVPQAVSSAPDAQLWVLSQQPLHDGPHPLPASPPLSLLAVLFPTELPPLLAPPPLPLLPMSDDDPPPMPGDRSSPAPLPSATPPSSPKSATSPAPLWAHAPRVTSPASTAAPNRMPLDAGSGSIDHLKRSFYRNRSRRAPSPTGPARLDCMPALNRPQARV